MAELPARLENRLYYAGRFQGSAGYVRKPRDPPVQSTLELKVVAARLSGGGAVSPAVLVHLWEATGPPREWRTAHVAGNGVDPAWDESFSLDNVDLDSAVIAAELLDAACERPYQSQSNQIRILLECCPNSG